MINQTSVEVNQITINELRLSFLHFLPSLALTRSRKPPAIACSYLLSSVDFQKEYGTALAATGTARLPWSEGYGKLFWARYVPIRNPYEMWRALVPLDYDLSPHVTSLVLTDGGVAAKAYLYPWGIGVIVDVTVRGPLPLKDAVNRAQQIRGQAKIEWKFGTKSGTASPGGLATALRELLGPLIYGDKVVSEEPGEPFSIATVTDADGASYTESITENGPLHHALEGLTGWNLHWDAVAPSPLAAAAISARKAPAGNTLYGKLRGRAIWFPADFRHVAAYSETLSCYHQNLSAASLHTESLCQLVQNAATELRDKGSLDGLSALYRDSSQLAAGILGRLHGRKTDESSGQKPKTYRSGSIRAQIRTYSDDVNLLRLSIPTIKSALDA
jgi:hypothetical protein